MSRFDDLPERFDVQLARTRAALEDHLTDPGPETEGRRVEDLLALLAHLGMIAGLYIEARAYERARSIKAARARFELVADGCEALAASLLAFGAKLASDGALPVPSAPEESGS